MPRRPTGPRFYPSRGAYFVTINRHTHNLGSDEREAIRRYHALMLLCGDGPAPTVTALIDRYLAWLARNREPDTYRTTRTQLNTFIALFPALTVAQLKRHHVEEWLSSRTWASGSCSLAVGRLLATLNWSVDQGLIDRNPIRGTKKPPTRARVTLISLEQHEYLVRWSRRRTRDSFADLLECLWATGCRPGEAAKATAEDFDRGLGAIVLRKHKTARRTGKLRVIYLTGDALEHAREVKSGLLYPNEWGRRYSVKRIVGKIDTAKAARPELFTDQTAYSYRHRFATDWLRAGRPMGHLAALLGTSVAMIQRHYGHLDEYRQDLRAAAAGFAEAGVRCTPPGSPSGS
jgi:integrase